MRERRNLADSEDDNFNILDTKQTADALFGTTKVMTTLLGAVAALSRLIGGLVFVYFPARRAARMDPIEALRHE